MDAKKKGVQRVLRKGISPKRSDISDSKKPELGDEKDNKNDSITDVFSSQSSDEKPKGKKRGRKRKNEVPDNEKNTKMSSVSSPDIKESKLEKTDTVMQSTNDLPGMSLRRSRKTRQSGSSVSDKEADPVLSNPEKLIKLQDGNSEEKQAVSKFPVPSEKEDFEVKKSKSIQDVNEDKQINSDIVDDTSDDTLSVPGNSRKKRTNKNTAIKKSGSMEMGKEGDEKPTRTSPRCSSRILSKNSRSESISSESERESISQRPKTVSQKLTEKAEQAESLGSEQDTDLELKKNILIKEAEETVARKMVIPESNPNFPTTARKRGRRRKVEMCDPVPSVNKKTEVGSDLDTESFNAEDEVSNKRKGKRKLDLPRVSKLMEDSFSEGNDMTDTDISVNAEMDHQHKKGSANNDSKSKDSIHTEVIEEGRKNISSDTNTDGISESSLSVNERNNASCSEEKEPYGKKAEVTVPKKRGRKKKNQAESGKFGYESKNSEVYHASDLKNNGEASKDIGILEVPNQDTVVPLINTRTSHKRRNLSHSNKELEKEKFEIVSSEESSDSKKVQKVDSKSCAIPNSKTLPIKINQTSVESDIELCSNKSGTAHQSKNDKTDLTEKRLSKRTKIDEHSTLDLSSNNVDYNDKCDKNIKIRGFKGKRQRGRPCKRKSRNIQLNSKESYFDSFKGNFLINDLSVVVEKLDLNDPQIIKLMSHSFTSENARSMEEKSEETQKEVIDHSIDEDMDITALDSTATQICKTSDESLDKEAIVHIDTKNADETTFSNTEQLFQLDKNQIPNLEIPVHIENTLKHCYDLESEDTQTDCSENISDNLMTSTVEVEKLLDMNDSKKLSDEVKNVTDFSLCDSEEILDKGQDKSEEEIQEKQKGSETISNSINSDTTSTSDQLSANISENQNDQPFEQPISANKDETSSNFSEHSCDSSGNSIEKAEEKTGNSSKINYSDPKTESHSKKLIEGEDIFIALEPSEDSIHGETVLLSVKQNEIKECYVDMSNAIDISEMFFKKNDSFYEKPDAERKICFNSLVSPTQNNPTDIESTEDANATFEAVYEGEKDRRELMVDTALEFGEVPDSGLIDEKVAALEDNREVNDELEVREDYNAAIKDMNEITGCGPDIAAMDVDREVTEEEIGDMKENIDCEFDVSEIDIAREVTEVGLEDKNNILEDQNKAAPKELLVQKDMILKDGKEIEINVLKSRKDAFEKEVDTLEEVSETALEEIIKTNTTLEQAKNEAGLKVDGFEEQDKNDAVPKLCKTKSLVTSLEDAGNTNLKDESHVNPEAEREINLEHERELECVTTEEESLTALEDKTKGTLKKTKSLVASLEDAGNTNLEDASHVNPEAERETNLEHERELECVTTEEESLSALEDKTNGTLKTQLKPQLINDNIETKESKHTKDVTDESYNEVCAALEHPSKVGDDVLLDHTQICKPDADNENESHFTKSDLFKKMQNFLNMEPVPDNFSSATKSSNLQLVNAEPNSQSSMELGENDSHNDLEDTDQCVDSNLKISESFEPCTEPVKQNSDSFESDQPKPVSSNTGDKPAEKRKFEEVEPERYYWPKFSNQLTWDYLQPFAPVLIQALNDLCEAKKQEQSIDEVQYVSDWLNSHKKEAYFTMASIPMEDEFKLKKPKR